MSVEPPQAEASIDGRNLTLQTLEAIARRGAAVRLAPAAIPAIEASRAAVDRIAAAGVPTYGVNTGLGALSNRAIPDSELRALQHNLLRSHAAGAGKPLPVDVVRATMLIRANSLARGHSGVRETVIETLLALLNAGVTPLIPSQGSLGASGDLAPLAHLGVVLTGEGVVIGPDGESMPASDALAGAGIEPLRLESKEALAIINGTAVIAALAGLGLADARRLIRSAVVVAGLSAFALGARREPFDVRLHEARPHHGQVRIAMAMRDLLGSLDPQHRATGRVQDPYSVRCVPPVIGAVLDALRPLDTALQVDLNAATDNPLVFADDDAALSGGNFHGHPLALPVEYLKVAIASLGTLTERRVALLVDGEEYGLPAFLVANPGTNSGYMIAHYLTAGLVAENKVLAHPSAVDSIPTSANIEDYNSMGTTAARHLTEIVGNVTKIVAVEALCAAQACDLREIVPPGILGEAYRAIREHVAPLESDDRVMAVDIERAVELVASGRLAQLVDLEAGER